MAAMRVVQDVPCWSPNCTFVRSFSFSWPSNSTWLHFFSGNTTCRVQGSVPLKLIAGASNEALPPAPGAGSAQLQASFVTSARHAPSSVYLLAVACEQNMSAILCSRPECEDSWLVLLCCSRSSCAESMPGSRFSKHTLQTALLLSNVQSGNMVSRMDSLCCARSSVRFFLSCAHNITEC